MRIEALIPATGAFPSARPQGSVSEARPLSAEGPVEGASPLSTNPSRAVAAAVAPSPTRLDPGADIPGKLTDEEQAEVADLKARDREVRAHEQAHKTVAGPYAGAISYDFQTGPDGNQYAVSGEVPIDVSAEEDPESTIAKMEIVIRAALAPAEPSSADRAVAAAARQQLNEARAELAAQRAAERAGEDGAAPRLNLVA